MVKSEGPDDGVTHAAPDGQLLTLEELTARVGLSVRTVRFYTSRGLVPPPIRRGRSGFCSAEHVARIELVLELQSHGFTLSAIERYVAEGAPKSKLVQRTGLRLLTYRPLFSGPAVERTPEDRHARPVGMLS